MTTKYNHLFIKQRIKESDMEHILQPNEVRSLGRPIGKVADDKLNAFITEAEQLHIKPILGDVLFLDVLTEIKEGGNDKIRMLLDGGVYKDGNDRTRSFMGLRVSISYFVYAQNLMSGDIESTRFGSVMKNDDYSTRISSKERSDAYNNAIDVAKAYLNECVTYCKDVGLIKSSGKPKFTAGGITIRKIG